MRNRAEFGAISHRRKSNSVKMSILDTWISRK
jgi:hypothetical protein